MKLKNIYKIHAKIYYVMVIKQHLWENVLNLQSIQDKILPIIFPMIQLTKHFIDWVLADYNGYYM